jgi:hypothetical protein
MLQKIQYIWTQYLYSIKNKAKGIPVTGITLM